MRAAWLCLWVTAGGAAASNALAAWCATLREEPPRQPCWGAAELKRRSRAGKAATLEEKLRLGASSEFGTPVFPSEGGQDKWLWEHHLRFLRRPIVYADLGANDFLHTSNTFFLDACAGARGVCVEASPHYAGAYAAFGRTCDLVTERAAGGLLVARVPRERRRRVGA